MTGAVQQLAFDLGAALKREGQQAVLDGAGGWATRARNALRRFLATLAADAVFAMEDFRAWATVDDMLDSPSHHNAWGAFTNLAIRDGLIEPTGTTRRAVSARTHAHPVGLYRRGHAAGVVQ